VLGRRDIGTHGDQDGGAHEEGCGEAAPPAPAPAPAGGSGPGRQDGGGGSGRKAGHNNTNSGGGGIRRSSVTHSASANARKRQCRLSDMWAAKQPEVEDGASRFSGF
jgi:hypothetical protein